jgi:Spy/CpxP family protein refolding chaperone
MRNLWAAMLVVAATTFGFGQNGSPSAPTPSPQDGGPRAQNVGPRRTLEGQAELRQLTTQLGLTADQREKLRPIVTDEGDQLSAVRLDEHMPPVQKKAKAQAIRESFRPKIDAILTPEQQEKWKKMQESAMGNGAMAPQGAPPQQ